MPKPKQTTTKAAPAKPAPKATPKAEVASKAAPAKAPAAPKAPKVNKKENVTSTKVDDFVQKFLSEHVDNPEVMDKWRTERGSLDTLISQMTKGKTKKVRDPNAPKRPAPAYIIFSNQMRATVKEENPEMKSTEILSELGRRWRSLSEKEKAKYQKQADEGKAAYERELETYTPTPGFPSLKKKNRDPALKKPPTGYILYCNETRESLKKKNPELSPKEVMAKLGQMWKALPDKKKKVYNDRSAVLKEEFKARTEAAKPVEDEEEPVSEEAVSEEEDDE